MASTGLRRWKYRVITRPRGNFEEYEEACNKFAGFGYRLVNQSLDTRHDMVVLTFQRRTRKPKAASAGATPQAAAEAAPTPPSPAPSGS